jgi:hypothetical protein
MGKGAFTVREVVLAEHEPRSSDSDLVTVGEFQVAGQDPPVDEGAVGALHIKDDVATVCPSDLGMLSADLVVHDLGGAALVATDDERAPSERVIVARVRAGCNGE